MSDEDLQLTFSKPIAVQWEDEIYGLIDLPIHLPKCDRQDFNNWAYPTLVVSDSNWAARYAQNMFSEVELESKSVIHFVFIAMNDLLHVLSETKPTTKLIERR